ncbi:MAG: SIS domain-containing protein [Planctomycetes bacterium]|nr:SIS domain-containing protein [Planctomycetota bacterium]
MDELKRRLEEGSRVCKALADGASPLLYKAAVLAADVLNGGRTIYVLGDGDNMLTARHLAGLFVTKHEVERRALPVIAFPVDSSLLALVGNDYGFDEIFARQVAAFVEKGDLVFALGTSGNERQVLGAVAKAREQEARTVGLAGGDGGALKSAVDLFVSLPVSDPLYVMEAHMAAGHAFYHTVERLLFVKDKVGTTKSLIRFTCRNCGEKIFSEERFMGRKGTCPNCHSNIVVPNVKAERVNVNAMATQEKEGAEKRVHMRFSVQDCILHYSRESFFEAGKGSFNHFPLENLSQGGCQYLSAFQADGKGEPRSDLAVDDEIWVSIDVPAFIEPINARGTVRRVETVAEKSSFRVGVEFTECKEVDREKLRKLCENVVLRNIRRSQGLY